MIKTNYNSKPEISEASWIKKH